MADLRARKIFQFNIVRLREDDWMPGENRLEISIQHCAIKSNFDLEIVNFGL